MSAPDPVTDSVPVADLGYADASDELDAIIAELEDGVIDVDLLEARLRRAVEIVEELDRRIRGPGIGSARSCRGSRRWARTQPTRTRAGSSTDSVQAVVSRRPDLARLAPRPAEPAHHLLDEGALRGVEIARAVGGAARQARLRPGARPLRPDPPAICRGCPAARRIRRESRSSTSSTRPLCPAFELSCDPLDRECRAPSPTAHLDRHERADRAWAEASADGRPGQAGNRVPEVGEQHGTGVRRFQGHLSGRVEALPSDSRNHPWTQVCASLAWISYRSLRGSKGPGT